MPSIKETIRFPVQLTYLAGANNYTWLHFRNGRQVLLSKPLTYFETRLPQFVRVHKTALVNPDCVEGIQPPPRPKMAGKIRLEGGVELPVSRRRWSQIRQRLHRTGPDPAPHLSQPNEGISPVAQRIVMTIMAHQDQAALQQATPSTSIPFVFQGVTIGAGLPEFMLISPASERPSLIIIDARTSPQERLSLLRAFKSYPALRTIPVVILLQEGSNVQPVYDLDANSVVLLPDDPAQFVEAINRLCTYWFSLVRLPPVPVS